MGLMYITPNSTDDPLVLQQQDVLEVRSYGLPLIFWGYYIAFLVTLFALAFASYNPWKKLLLTNDPLNMMICYSLAIIVIGIPFVCLAFFLYQKVIVRTKSQLILKHAILHLPYKVKKIKLSDISDIVIRKQLDSPNMAKIANNPEFRGFQNKGYFVLEAETQQKKKIVIDRSSSKVDLEKLKDILFS
jgi:hypothetical protein